jgi:hypothetical protein
MWIRAETRDDHDPMRRVTDASMTLPSGGPPPDATVAYHDAFTLA